MILAGDIGGTKVHLALYSFEGGRLKWFASGGLRRMSLPRWTRR